VAPCTGEYNGQVGTTLGELMGILHRGSTSTVGTVLAERVLGIAVEEPGGTALVGAGGLALHLGTISCVVGNVLGKL